MSYKFDPIKAAKISLLQRQPFFGCLSTYLTYVYEEKMPHIAGVNNKGVVMFSKKFLELPRLQQEAVIAHEVLHCFRGETPVLTQYGFVPIEKIKVGDLVYSAKDCFTPVLHVNKRKYCGEMIKISPQFADPVYVTPEHPIAIQDCNYKICKGFSKSLLQKGFGNGREGIGNGHIWKQAGELKKHDVLVYPIKSNSKPNTPSYRARRHYQQYKIKLNADFAYFLGWFMGDGSIHRVKKSRMFGIRRKEKYSERVIVITASLTDQTERLKTIIEKTFLRKATSIHPKNVKVERIYISSRSLVRFLRERFYHNNHKTIPKWFLGLPTDIIEQFIQGMLESDGCITNGCSQIGSSEPGIYSFLPLLLLRLGKQPSLKRMAAGGFPNQKPAFKVLWHDNKTKQYGLIHKKRWYIPIRKVERTRYSGYVYNLQTKMETYTVPLFLVHNCAFQHLARLGYRSEILWNISTDSWINKRLELTGFKLPNGSIDQKNLNTMFGINITDEMGSEERYDQLRKHCKIIKVCGGWDDHKYGDKSGEKDGEASAKANAEKWQIRVQKAAAIARQQGKVPAGFEKLFDDLLGSGKIPWHRVIIKKLNNLTFNSGDFSYRIPSRFSRVFPDYVTPIVDKKPNIEVVIGLDSSGSIGDDDWLTFLSEIQHMSKKVKGIKFSMVTCDAEVHDTMSEGTDIKKLVKALRNRKGYGGTNLAPAFDWIQKNAKKARMIIFFSDLMATFPNYIPRLPVIWVLPPKREEIVPPFGRVLRIE